MTYSVLGECGGITVDNVGALVRYFSLWIHSLHSWVQRFQSMFVWSHYFWACDEAKHLVGRTQWKKSLLYGCWKIKKRQRKLPGPTMTYKNTPSITNLPCTRPGSQKSQPSGAWAFTVQHLLFKPQCRGNRTAYSALTGWEWSMRWKVIGLCKKNYTWVTHVVI